MPICMGTEHLAGVAESSPMYKMKFDAKWLAEDTVKEIVKTAWQKAHQCGLYPSVTDKLFFVHKDLHTWDRKILKGPRACLRKAQNEFESLMRLPFSTDVSIKQNKLAVYIENLLEQDEIYWAQRGRVSWLRRGDRNTSYFQHIALPRRKRNLIKLLKTDNGGLVEGNDNMKPSINEYFSSLFTSNVGDPGPSLLGSIKPLVSRPMNDMLTSPYTRDEVRKALFQI